MYTYMDNFFYQTVLYMAMAVSIVQNPDLTDDDIDVSTASDNNGKDAGIKINDKGDVSSKAWYWKCRKFVKHMGNHIFYGITSFAKGEVTSESDGTSYTVYTIPFLTFYTHD